MKLPFTSFDLPFVARIFWGVLAVVIVLVLVGWFLIVKLTEYEMLSADYGGSGICTVLLAYLLHLWILPHEESPTGDDQAGGGEGSATPQDSSDHPG